MRITERSSFLSLPIFCSSSFSALVCLALLALVGFAGCSGNQDQPSSSEAIIISAPSGTIRTDDKEILNATQKGISVNGGQWMVLGGSANGQIDPDGTYHAPNIVPTPNTISVAYVVDNKTFTYPIQILNAIPVLSSASPTILHSFTNQVAITGSNFVKGATVLVNGQATTTSFIDSSHLTASISVAGIVSSSVTISVSNPAPGASTSSSLSLAASVTPISISPSSLNGGTVTLAISGSGFTTDMVASLDGQVLATTINSGSSMTATGFLAPWRTGTVQMIISSKTTSTVLAEESIPIAPTAVSFDAAARFLTQAGFGPRPDLIQHVQQVGMDAFITEQQALPVVPYQTTDMGVITIVNRAALGTAPLQMRVAWALQSFLVRTGIFYQVTNFPFEEKMEADSTGNFRDLLTDISSDPSMAMFLNLEGNAAPSDPSVHPNQNFGRELLQLFTIGTVMLNDDGTVQTGSDGTPIPAFNEDTVLEVSRALTGWVKGPSINPGYTFYGIDWSSPLVANESQHDKGQKQIFNTILPAGQTASEDRAMTLDAIFAHPNLPPFVSRILIQRMVKSNPSPDYVKRVATIFKDDSRGVRGNMAAVIRAILLDPEARLGDTTPSSSDGFLQEPYLFETFAMNIIGWTATDSQPSYLPCVIGECIYAPTTVFGFFSPSYTIPGTTINSPEFQILNDITLINRSQLLWGMITGLQGGFPTPNTAGWLYKNFKTIPALVDALNHLAYHGQMSTEEQNFIINYCTNLQTTDPLLARESAIFLALNADNYTVAH